MTIEQARSVGTMRVHTVRGGNGVRLHAREWGRPHGPSLLLIHGWSQSLHGWRHQVEGELTTECRVVAMDLRGHGMSERPAEAAAYQDPTLWAADVAAVIDQLGLERPVLVGWSYAGFVITDYLRAYGEQAVAAVNLVGAAVRLDKTFQHIGPAFLANAGDASDPDLTLNTAAIRRFLRACTVEPLAVDDWENALCWNMVVPPEVRGALISRQVNADDVLSTLGVPVLVTHGTQDAVVLPSMAEHVLAVCPGAVASWYDGIGHIPFIEARDRFDQELLDLVRRVN